MIKLIGTNHLQDSKEIKEIIEKEKPDIIAVEMCKERYLNHMKGKIRKDNSIWGKIANKMQKVTSKEGMRYGNDMVTAMQIAENKNIPLELVDRDIDETKRLLKKLPIREKLLIWASYMMINKKKVKKMKDNAEEKIRNKKVEEYTKKLKEAMPKLYDILVEQRNKYIFNRLVELYDKNPDKDIMVFLGAGHVEGINKEFRNSNKKKCHKKKY